MTLSLLKTTGNVSGPVTPNALLYGFFEFTIYGDLVMNTPSLASDGQFISIAFVQPTSTVRTVTWNPTWVTPLGQSQFDGSGLGAGNKWQGLFFCNDGKQIMVNGFNY